MRHIATAAALLACAALVAPAAAQNPSADQIIRSLRPTGPSGTTRGIRPVGPSAEPSAAAPGAAVTTRVTPGAPGTTTTTTVTTTTTATPPAPSVNLTVQFASGSAELTPQAARTLDQLGQALTSSALAGYRFRIEGHTDTVGTPQTNKALSDLRAAKVVDYLSTRFQVDRNKVEAVGMGQEQLLVPTGPNVPQARNRRVTVVNLGA